MRSQSAGLGRSLYFDIRLTSHLDRKAAPESGNEFSANDGLSGEKNSEEHFPRISRGFNCVRLATQFVRGSPLKIIDSHCVGLMLKRVHSSLNLHDHRGIFQIKYSGVNEMACEIHVFLFFEVDVRRTMARERRTLASPTPRQSLGACPGSVLRFSRLQSQTIHTATLKRFPGFRMRR